MVSLLDIHQCLLQFTCDSHLKYNVLTELRCMMQNFEQEVLPFNSKCTAPSKPNFIGNILNSDFLSTVPFSIVTLVHNWPNVTVMKVHCCD